MSAPAADRHADVGLRERRRVVDAVAHHGDDLPFCLQPPNLGDLAVGKHAGDHAVDAGLARDRLRRATGCRR